MRELTWNEYQMYFRKMLTNMQFYQRKVVLQNIKFSKRTPKYNINETIRKGQKYQRCYS